MKNILKYLAGILMMMIVAGNSYAQSNMTKIKDATIPGTTTTPAPGAVLELESNSKGLLVPRMTTTERDGIANKTDGLLIFNTTTGCFNYYQRLTTNWLSICGTPPPAVFDVTNFQCTQVKVEGTYKEGQNLTLSNFISIPVTVAQSGTYTISVTSGNGYYFTAGGVFPSAGAYTVIAQGVGTPGTDGTDSLNISFNGAAPLTSCHPLRVIENAAVAFTMKCNETTTAGTYLQNISLTSANTMTVSVNVSSIGFYSINTNVVNGYSFTGSGNFTATGDNTVVLSGTGKPVQAGTNSFTLTSNSDSNPSCTGASVVVPPTTYSVNCAGATVNGTYTQNVATNASNTITLPVNVTATGNYSITTNTLNGVSFAASGNFSTVGDQTVTLQATGTPTAAAVSNFTVTSDGGAATCSLPVSMIVGTGAVGTVDCTTAVAAGTLIVGKPATGANTLSLTLNVVATGAYNFTTNTLNGITYSASGTFNGTGNQTVVLTATGTPLATAVSTYTLTSTLPDPDFVICNNLKSTVVADNAAFSNVTCTALGTYKEKKAITSNEKITLSFNVTTTGSYSFTIAESTTPVSGLTFAPVSGNFTTLGTQTISFPATGPITANGDKTFVITNALTGTQICSTTINIAPAMGGFTNPATSCLAILTDNPAATDGEYYVKNSSGVATKTFCDMTNGGYTLIWSYSENTAYNTYAPSGMTVDVAYKLTLNVPINQVNTQTGTINYNNFRLSKPDMVAVKQTATAASKYRVRITNSPTDINDAWGAANYLEVAPQNAVWDYVIATAGGYVFDRSVVPVTGKVFGFSVGFTGNNSDTYNGVASNAANAAYINSGLADHFDIGRRFGQAATTAAQRLITPPGSSIAVDMNTMNDLFGVFLGGDDQGNHHFGKCGGINGSETDWTFATQMCNGGTLVPHTSINNGEGRILQWFIL